MSTNALPLSSSAAACGPARARRRRRCRAARAAPAPAPAPWRASARSRRSPAARAAAPRTPSFGRAVDSMQRTLVQSSPVAWRISAPTVRRATRRAGLAAAARRDVDVVLGLPARAADHVRDRRRHLRQRAAADGDRGGAVRALALAADLRRSWRRMLVRVSCRPRSATSSLRRSSASAARRARSAVQRLRPRRRVRASGCGSPRSASPRTRRRTRRRPRARRRSPPCAPRLALDVGLGLVELGGQRAGARVGGLALVDQLAREADHLGRLAHLAAQRARVQRRGQPLERRRARCPCSQRTVRARVTRARSANTTTLSMSPRGGGARGGRRRGGRRQHAERRHESEARRQFW